MASITAGPAGTTASSDASFAFTSGDVTAAYECSLDAQPWTTCSIPAGIRGPRCWRAHLRRPSEQRSRDRRAGVTQLDRHAASSPRPLRLQPRSQAAPQRPASEIIEDLRDTVEPGTAEAFPMTATAAGPLPALRVYLDDTNRATTLVAGIYADAGGRPGSRIAQGTVSSPQPGAWTTLDLSDASVSEGTRYWVAVLGSGGTLAFRDRSDCELLERDERLLVADLAAVGVGIRSPVEHLSDLRVRHVVVGRAATRRQRTRCWSTAFESRSTRARASAVGLPVARTLPSATRSP